MGTLVSQKQPRAAAPINSTLEKQLATYMMVAAATGVGVLALAHPSDAEIVYTATNQVLNQPDGVTVDFNNDGIVDIKFFDQSRGYGTVLWAYASGQNRFMSASYPGNSVLPWGKRIGPKGTFNSHWAFLAGANHHFGSCVTYGGPWINKRGFYLGVQFSIGSEIHYGWVRLTITPICTVGKEVITGYAYETIPNKPILAGKTSGPKVANVGEPDEVLAPFHQQGSLGTLALGAGGMSIWRREEEVA
ncbi:MAG TPA: hypothetical protein VMH04_06755 [Candidatus Solibacter sp.]|nr:hypothetical protein [Candidatus Solibacter sp.]